MDMSIPWSLLPFIAIKDRDNLGSIIDSTYIVKGLFIAEIKYMFLFISFYN